MPDPTRKALSKTLGDYYKNLTAQDIPQTLVEAIVMDAAQALHRGEIVDTDV